MYLNSFVRGPTISSIILQDIMARVELDLHIVSQSARCLPQCFILHLYLQVSNRTNPYWKRNMNRTIHNKLGKLLLMMPDYITMHSNTRKMYFSSHNRIYKQVRKHTRTWHAARDLTETKTYPSNQIEARLAEIQACKAQKELRWGLGRTAVHLQPARIPPSIF